MCIRDSSREYKLAGPVAAIQLVDDVFDDRTQLVGDLRRVLPLGCVGRSCR